MISRNIEYSFELSPRELAEEFCNMDSDEQASFFGWISLISKEWDKPFVFQLQEISDSKILSEQGRKIMREIGEYSEESK